MAIDFSQYLVGAHGQQLFCQLPAQTFTFGSGCATLNAENLAAINRADQAAQPHSGVVVFEQSVSRNGDLATAFQAPVQCTLGLDPVGGVGVIQRLQQLQQFAVGNTAFDAQGTLANGGQRQGIGHAIADSVVEAQAFET